MSITRRLPQDPERCYRKRIAAGWTQQETADRSGLSNATINDVENGKVAALPRTLRTLAETFGCEISDLMPADVEVSG